MFHDENNWNGVQAFIRLTSDYALYQEALQKESIVMLLNDCLSAYEFIYGKDPRFNCLSLFKHTYRRTHSHARTHTHTGAWVKPTQSQKSFRHCFEK